MLTRKNARALASRLPSELEAMSRLPSVDWQLARGGRSINVGDYGKLRIEAGVGHDQVVATMQLASAAPDLLSVAYDLLSVFDCDDAECTCAPGDTCPVCRCANAIAKATGKEL